MHVGRRYCDFDLYGEGKTLDRMENCKTGAAAVDTDSHPEYPDDQAGKCPLTMEDHLRYRLRYIKGCFDGNKACLPYPFDQPFADIDHDSAKDI